MGSAGVWGQAGGGAGLDGEIAGTDVGEGEGGRSDDAEPDAVGVPAAADEDGGRRGRRRREKKSEHGIEAGGVWRRSAGPGIAGGMVGVEPEGGGERRRSGGNSGAGEHVRDHGDDGA